MFRSKSRSDQLVDAASSVKDAVVGRVDDVRKSLPDNPADLVDRDVLRNAADTAASGLKDRAVAADEVVRDDWVPRLQELVAAALAGTSSAVATLPQPAQDQVAKVAPSLVKKKRGGVLIALGLAALGGAGYLYWKGQQENKPAAPPVGGTGPRPADDLVGDSEKRAQDTLAGAGPTGKHAASE